MIRPFQSILLVTLIGMLLLSSHSAFAQTHDYIGLVIDSGDPVLTQMGQELAKFVMTDTGGLLIKPTLGPVANVQRMLSRENAGLGIVPSDMLSYTDRATDPTLRQARRHLRFIMSIGTKEVHLLARKELQRFEDLEGKRVIVGKSDTGIWVTANNLLHVMGVRPAEKWQMPPAESIAAVLLHKADAAFVIGDAPLPLMTNIKNLQEYTRYAHLAEHVHLIPLHDPKLVAAYASATVHYPGFAEHVETIAIRPTLVSYDFGSLRSEYYQRRCGMFKHIGATVQKRFEELRVSGHAKWQEATWQFDPGTWEKDPCFYGSPTQSFLHTPAGYERDSDGSYLTQIRPQSP